MTILFDFLIFSFFVFVSNSILSISTIRMERRIGVRSDFIRLFFNILPTYIKNIIMILFLFLATKLLYLEIIDKKIFIFVPLLIFFISKTKLKSQKYTELVTTTACLVSVVICVLTATTFNNSSIKIVEYNPFRLLALVMAMISVYFFNKDKSEPVAVNIARNLALNMYTLYLFIPAIPFIYSTIISFGILYIQFIIDSFIPKLNLFQTMRNSSILLITISLLGFLGNLIWTVLILGAK
ncbi:MAG: hypothetical protein WCQ47_03065 [bacterium]